MFPMQEDEDNMMMNHHRSLQSAPDPDKTSTEYIIQSLQFYGGIFVGLFIIYCIVRKKLPRVYAVRQWVPEIRNPLADNQFGYVSWLWKVYSFKTDEIRDFVGFDALCFLRFMNMGFRMACIGAFNSCWLLPVYLTANGPDGEQSSDLYDRMAINNLDEESLRFIAPVIGSYIFFGYSMYTILKEFRWFIAERHIWLRKLNQRNYTIFVREIPEELRSDKELKEHFQMLYGLDRVLEANMSLYMTDLVSKNAKRKTTVDNLEHALAELAITGKRPKHLRLLQAIGNTVGSTVDVVGQTATTAVSTAVTTVTKKEMETKKKEKGAKEESEVDSIDFYTEELNKLNEEIAEAIDAIKRKNRPTMSGARGETFRRYQTSSISSDGLGVDLTASQPLLTARGSSSKSLHNSDGEMVDFTPEKLKTIDDGEEEKEEEAGERVVSLNDNDNRRDSMKKSSSSGSAIEGLVADVMSSSASLAKKATASSASMAKQATASSASMAKDTGSLVKDKAEKYAKKRVDQAKSTVSNVGNVATAFLVGGEEGTADNAGFVTFTSLVAVHSALQMSQHATPFVLECETAPDVPKHMIWKNVGKDKEALMTGRLLSLAATVALCLFWTVIVTFVVNLTNVESLTENSPDLAETIEKNPWITSALNLVSPLLLLIFNTGLLPIFLKLISLLEFPASDSLLEHSCFWKMAAFQIIQTFFVTLFSSSIIEGLDQLFDNPVEYVKTLAGFMVEHSAYFVQLLIVSSCIGTMVELFRVVPLSQALGRVFVGKRLTEKERSTNLGILRPLCVVDKFYYSRVQARFLLYFMVNFVYSSITPIVNWFCLFFFLFLGSVYRHQFIFNFPPTPDSGGEIWLSFMHVLLVCCVIAQFTLLGIMILKQSVAGSIMMIPLLAVFCMFIAYLHQRHFVIGKHLPARECLRQDLQNAEEDVDFETLFKEEYKHPALKERFLDADWDAGKEDADKKRAKEEEKKEGADYEKGVAVEEAVDDAKTGDNEGDGVKETAVESDKDGSKEVKVEDNEADVAVEEKGKAGDSSDKEQKGDEEEPLTGDEKKEEASGNWLGGMFGTK